MRGTGRSGVPVAPGLGFDVAGDVRGYPGRGKVGVVGTIGTYHYDDEQCRLAVMATTVLVAHLANEVRAQGPAFLDHYLATIRDMVTVAVGTSGDPADVVTVARGAPHSRTRDAGRPD